MRSSLDSLSRCWPTAGTPSSFRRCRHRWPEQSTFSAPNEFTSSTSRSHRRSGPFLAGAQEWESTSPRYEKPDERLGLRLQVAEGARSCTLAEQLIHLAREGARIDQGRDRLQPKARL